EQKLNQARELAAPVAGESWWVASYSALKTGEINDTHSMQEPENARQSTADEEARAEGTLSSQSLPVGNQQLTMHQFPRGPKPGTFLHSLLEWAAAESFATALTADEARRDYIARCCSRHSWDKWIQPLDNWIKVLLDTPLPIAGQTVRLADIGSCLPEMEFWFESRSVNTIALDSLVHAQTLDAKPRPQLLNNLLNGMLKGFIDLVFEYNGQYFVADWKSNWLGDNAAAYTREAMCDAVLHKRYELQYTLYILALHRHLQDRLHDYDYDKHIGGAVYVFLRGIENTETRGVHFEKPSRYLIEKLDALFANTVKTGVAV
ncbi:MAG TPA: PD-(D/E)XK nuclease family protein, partial [Pseudomonadales bacterium]|nr:PD-(D/E)XK nuclease family protein [Pseudomonadales bacterium]